tara:strand:+ start:1790 stop:2038 length:249 start_codon:yes stop_codon:yes gene_type:complete
MKLQIKLTKEQAEAFKSFSETLKPAEADQEQWLKMIFFTGIETINAKVYEMAEEMAEEKAEGLATSGITILEDEDGLHVSAV